MHRGSTRMFSKGFVMPSSTSPIIFIRFNEVLISFLLLSYSSLFSFFLSDLTPLLILRKKKNNNSTAYLSPERLKSAYSTFS